MNDILVLLGLNLGLIAAAMIGLWAAVPRLKTFGFLDAAWPLGLLTLALVTLPRTEGDATRKWLLIWLGGVWAVGLGRHLLTRRRRQGAARRYEGLIAGVQAAQGWSARTASLLAVFLPLGVLIWLVALPVQLGQVAGGPLVGGLGWTGAALAVIGIGLGGVADAQLSAFQRVTSTGARVLDTGLWRYSRHPNRFGDVCVWWGLWLIAAETTTGLFAVLGPLVLTLILAPWRDFRVTPPSPIMSEPAYAGYVSRTSGFVPWPPRPDSESGDRGSV